jgi:RNA polymerase sigma factor (sigma-70 family)
LGIQRFATADIGRIFRGETVTGLSEWQLLERYLERRDEVAFEALVARHGPMVLGVCRRMLASQTDVEDAFQATFLVLVRRARQLGPRDAIGPWLHGVAARVALRARCEAARRRRFESVHPDVAALAPARPPADLELAETLDQELSRLPSKYRSPIVLCYLEGQTHEEAARVLKWPVGTVKGRLARARDLLRSRLVRRGLAPTALAITASLAKDASASVPRELLENTVNAGLKSAIGHTTTQVVSTSIASLVEGALTAMLFTKITWIGAGLLISALALTGAGVMAQQRGERPADQTDRASAPLADPAGSTVVLGPNVTAKSSSDPIATSRAASKTSSAAVPATTELAPDPSDPQGQLLQAAKRAWNKVYGEFSAGSGTVDRLHEVSALLMDAQKQSATSPAETASAIVDHLDRIRSIARLRQNIQHGSSTIEGDNAKLLAFAAKAQLELAQGGGGRGGEGPKPKRLRAELGAAPGHGKDPKSQLILTKLDDLVAMNFPKETPLDDILQHIKSTTKSREMPNGMPIYVDPVGLQEAEKSLTSTVTIDLEGVPLRRTLQLVLKQLGLHYLVEDGMIYITSEESEDNYSHLAPAIPEDSPILQEGEKALRGEFTVEEMKQWLEKAKMRLQVEKALHGENGPSDDSNAPLLTLNEEIKKLIALNNELKQKSEKLEAQMTEMRELMMQLVKREKEAEKSKEAKRKAGGLQ